MIADWINTTFASFDYALLEFFHTLALSASFILNPLMEFLSIIGDNGYFGFAIAIALMLFPKTRKWGAAVFLSILVGAIFTNLSIKNIVARPRPYASDVEAFKEWWAFAGAHLESEFSFPSGHTTAAVASMLAVCLCLFKKCKWIIAPATFYAVIMGFSRNYLVVHYPTDVIAGFIVGSIAAVIAFLLARLIWSVMQKHSDKRLFNFALNFDVRSLFRKRSDESTDSTQD